MFFAIVAAAALLPGQTSTPHDSLQRLFSDYWQTEMREHPQRATFLGDHRYDDLLDDYSEDAHHDWRDVREVYRATLARIAAQALSESDQLDADLFRRTLNDELDLDKFPMRLMPLGPQDGIHLDLPMLLLSHPFKTPRDYGHYVIRLRAFPEQVDQVIELMKAGIKQGIVPPRVIMGKVLEQVMRQVVDDPAKSEFHKPVARWADTIAKDERAGLTTQVDAAISEAVVPAYKKLGDFLRDDYLPKCRDSVGISVLPNGKAWYARLARYHTTTTKSPEEIHRIGLAQLDLIHAEMDTIIKKVGFKGDLIAFDNSLRERADMHAKSAADLMQRHAKILAASDAQLPKIFGRLPKQHYEVKEMEAFRAPEAPMAYYGEAPIDGDRPAYFYVNTYKPTERPLYTMEALAYHEAMPGHHLQIALAKEDTGMPMFRRHSYVTAYVEGWGLYSESLGKELGGYKDPYSDYGRLTFDAWRSCRLVVDTGMHALGWSRQKAIDFMKANTSMTELDITAEVDRYIAWPGQALAYKIGQLAIFDLRDTAKKRLGIKFDLRRFHDALLAFGPLPLDLLKQRMELWMAREGGADKAGG